MIMTFPANYPLSFIANISYRQQGVHGYFYSPGQIESLLRTAGMETVSFSKIFPSTYWVHARRAFAEPQCDPSKM